MQKRKTYVVHDHGNGAILRVSGEDRWHRNEQITGTQNTNQAPDNRSSKNCSHSHDRVLHVSLVELHHSATSAGQAADDKALPPESQAQL
jgi:hypothetical protein